MMSRGRRRMGMILTMMMMMMMTMMIIIPAFHKTLVFNPHNISLFPPSNHHTHLK